VDILIRLLISILTNRAHFSRYPSGSIAPLGELAHSTPNPVGFITWFEPERAHDGTYIQRTYPEYLFNLPGDADHLVNLGNPDANDYLYDYLSSAVTQCVALSPTPVCKQLSKRLWLFLCCTHSLLLLTCVNG